MERAPLNGKAARSPICIIAYSGKLRNVFPIAADDEIAISPRTPLAARL